MKFYLEYELDPELWESVTNDNESERMGVQTQWELDFKLDFGGIEVPAKVILWEYPENFPSHSELIINDKIRINNPEIKRKELPLSFRAEELSDDDN